MTVETFLITSVICGIYFYTTKWYNQKKIISPEKKKRKALF